MTTRARGGIFLAAAIVLVSAAAVAAGAVAGDKAGSGQGTSRDKADKPEKPEKPEGKAPRGAAVSCRKDSDCVLVPDDCCPCSAGGKQRAILAKDRRTYESARSEKCAETMCTAAMSTDPSCAATKAVCKSGSCALGGPPPPSGGG